MAVQNDTAQGRQGVLAPFDARARASRAAAGVLAAMRGPESSRHSVQYCAQSRGTSQHDGAGASGTLGPLDGQSRVKAAVASGPDEPASFDPRPLKSGDLFLAIRINNLPHIEAVYGRNVAALTLEEVSSVLRKTTNAQCRISSGNVIEVALPLSSRDRQRRAPAVIDDLCTKLMCQPVLAGAEKLHVSVSAGYAPVVQGDIASQVPHALAECHRALHAAWSVPDINTAWGDAWATKYRQDMQAAGDLLHKMSRGEAVHFYQPVRHSNGDGQTLYYESLLRTTRADGVSSSCGSCIKAVERLGLAKVLDKYSVSAVLDQLERHPAARLGVNISAQSASFNLNGRDSSWTELRERLAGNRTLGPRLTIEITESWPPSSLKDLVEFTRTLRALGCQIAVDDFGAGHNSLRQLLMLQPDIVKLDSFFIQMAERSPRARAMLHHAVGLACSVSPLVVIEGIESPSHKQIAEEEGLVWLQGYHLGEPGVTHSWAAD